jgi:hypothetical protein
MKKHLLILNFTVIFLMTGYMVNAQQLLFEENFNYTSGDPLVKGAIASSDNSATTTTGWLTISNTTSSGTNSFNISANGLIYAGYAGSGIGKALDYIDNGGQDVFKTFSSANTIPTPGAAYPGPKTIYLAFLIKVPAGDKDGAEYFMGIKYSNSAGDNNYFGRIFTKVSGNNIQFGISKSTAPTNTWTGDYPIDKTYLLVLKYTMGGLNGANNTEETNKYDDKVDLWVNPAIGGAEPAVATLHYENAADRDAYRYSTSNSLIGGLAAIYLRTPSTAGAIPAATIDGIRIGESWGKVVSPSTKAITPGNTENIRVYSNYANKFLTVDPGDNRFNQYEIYSVSGAKIMNEAIESKEIKIDYRSLNKGIYVLRLTGSSPSFSTKFVVD